MSAFPVWATHIDYRNCQATVRAILAGGPDGAQRNRAERHDDTTTLLRKLPD